jgi:predicted lipid carrier protein YhbT
VIEDDTEPGLEVKNLMDAIEPDAMPVLLRMGIQLITAYVEAELKQDATAPAVRAGVPC